MASSPRWTEDDNRRFKSALSQFPPDNKRLVNVAQHLPKPLEEVKYYYEKLVNDVYLPKPLENVTQHLQKPMEMEEMKYMYEKMANDVNQMPEYVPLAESSQSKRRKKDTPNPWTEEEQRLFLQGLKKYGEGASTLISTNFVKTKTPRQVSSHAQYYKRQKSDNKKEKRRSIFDITLESTEGNPDSGNQNPPDDDDPSQGQGTCLGV
ncbi:unnamed protein product [Arabidopsis thaliana]|uniref:Uncharacterized protein n=1 Tax=Arabidopsis thaliana TaxID=3702 RepID=A0A654FB36_ARATH|nr:unnamed protein product [Arabidopsis thaliana]